MPLSRSEIIELLHRFDVMPTSQRVQVAEVIFSKPQHLSAEQVLDKVSAMGHSISRATIYNTLGLFSEKGLVRQVIIDPDRVLYDPHTAPHHHLYNCESGELTDVDASTVEFKTIPELPAGTSLANVDVVFELRQAKSDSGS
ncbi:MAG: transcriptional repressor [Gammaproteobacteria bacterium]|nr:transcriptional repressor [Gammaproteobacteria bacterium]